MTVEVGDDASGPARRDWPVLAPCVAAMALLGALVLTYGYGRDQGIYAMVARAVLRGEMPYRDAWDFKPPGVYLVYALARALFGARQFGIRVIEVAGLAAMAWSMSRITKTLWGTARAGWFAGVVAFVAHAELDFWHTAQPESFGGMATIFAIGAVAPTLIGPLEIGNRKNWLRWAFAGACCGFAGLLKPHLAGAGPILALAIAARAWQSRDGQIGSRAVAAIKPAAIVTVGVFAPIALVVAWFSARGALGSLTQTLFGFAPHYTALSWAGQSIPGMVYWGVEEWLVAYSSFPTAGLLLWLICRFKSRPTPFLWIVGSIIVIHILGIVLQGKFFPYHYGATWPLTALVAGLGYEQAWVRLRSRGGLGVAAFVFIALVSASLRTSIHDLPGSFLARAKHRFQLFVLGPRDQESIDDLACVADVNAVANRAVAAWIAAHTAADRTVLIWGFEPVIYDLADRDPATRYLYDVPQRVPWARDSSRAELMRELARTRPAVVVVEHGDVFPFVTGDSLDSAQALEGFDALRVLLAERYTLAASIEDFDVYRGP